MGGRRGRARQAHTLAELRAFQAAYLAGGVLPTLKTEAESPVHLRGKVKTLTGANFQEAVLEGGRDVLVMFHAPWCGHCKALAPKVGVPHTPPPVGASACGEIDNQPLQV